MKKLVILLSVIAICLVGCTTNDIDHLANDTDEIGVSIDTTVEADDSDDTIIETDDLFDTVETDDPVVREDSDTTTPVSFEELEAEVLKDVEDTIDGLNAEWEELKSEIDTYDKYLNNKDKVKDFYDKITDCTEQLCIRLQKYTLRYARSIVASDMSTTEKSNAFDNLLDCIYEDASNKLLDYVYEDLLGDMLNTFYSGILSEYNNVGSFSEWYATNLNEYENWYDTSLDIYESWYDTTIDICDFYYDITIELWSYDSEGVEEVLKDYEEAVDKLS